MNKHKIKKITKLGSTASTLMLAIALLSGVSMDVHAEEITTTVEQTIDNTENKEETAAPVAAEPSTVAAPATLSAGGVGVDILPDTPSTGETTSTEKEEIIVTDTDEKTEYDYSYENEYNSKEEAEAAKDEKEEKLEDEGYQNIESNIVDNSTHTEYEVEKTIVEKEYAEKIIEDFLEDTADPNGTRELTSSSITENKKKAEQVIYELGTQSFESEEEVNEFIEDLEEKEGELNKNGEFTLETNTIVETTESEEYVPGDKIPINKTFNTLEEAEAYMEELFAADVKVNYTELHIETTMSSSVSVLPVDKTFDNLLEAQKYISELEAEGYDVSELKIKLSTFDETIWKDEEHVEVDPGKVDDQTFNYGHFDVTLVTKFTKIDEEGTETTVDGTMTVDNVTINDKNITMEKGTDPNRFDEEYASTERNKLSVTNKSLVEINGTVTYGDTTLPYTVKGYLSETQNVCKGRGESKGFDLEYASVTIINGKVYVDSNIISQYNVSGDIFKTYSTEKYTVKGYAMPYDVIKVENKTYTVNYVIKEQPYNCFYTVNAKAIETVPHFDLTITANKEIVKEKPVTPEIPDVPEVPEIPEIPEVPEVPNTPVIENNNVELPKTGDSSHIREALATMGLSAMGLMALGYYDLKEKEKVKTLTKKR